MKYKVTTTCTAVTDYIVIADSEDEAQEKIYNGEYESEEITDFTDENITSIEKV
jgi:hypothetical protein